MRKLLVGMLITTFTCLSADDDINHSYLHHTENDKEQKIFIEQDRLFLENGNIFMEDDEGRPVAISTLHSEDGRYFTIVKNPVMTRSPHHEPFWICAGCTKTYDYEPMRCLICQSTTFIVRYRPVK